MKKLQLFFALLLCNLSMVFAQSASEVTVDFEKKVPANALSITIPAGVKTVEAVLEEKFKKETKAKAKGAGKNTGFVGATYTKISASTMDYFYRVEKTDKDDKSSNVLLFISLGNNNFIKSDKYPQEMAAAKGELESLLKEVKIYDLTESVKGQEKAVEKVLEQQKKLEGEMTSLEKQLKETQANIEKNKGSQEKQKKSIEDEQNKLKQFKSDLDALSK
jgi:hypothetical protein